MNVRSVLEYVPYFRGRLFVLHIDARLLASRELVDALLDADALHEIGVQLVLVAEGQSTDQLLTRALECELHAAAAEFRLCNGEKAYTRVQEIIARRQVAIVASGTEGAFSPCVEELAVQLKAHKYICLLQGEPPTRDGQPIYAMQESEAALAEGCSQPELMQAAAALCRRGIPRVHMLSGQHRGVLLDELFSEEGVGTMVHTDSYREIRPLHVDDIPELLSMIGRSVVDAKLLNRTYESIYANMQSYFVYTLDDTIVGCVALYPFPQEQIAELGCLFIKRNYEGHGYGRAMCEMIKDKARDLGFKMIFAISQSAVTYFRDRLGYAELSREMLPLSRRKSLEESGRCSGVFGVEL